MKKIKVIITMLLMIGLLIANCNNVVNAVGAMDSKPGVVLGPETPPSYAPGQQIQEQKEEEEKKNEEEKRKEEVEKKKNYTDKQKKKFTADEIVDYIQVVYKNNSGGVLEGSLGKIEENKEVIKEWEKTLKKANYNEGNAEQIQTYNALSTAVAAAEGKKEFIYKKPDISDSDSSSTETIDGIITDGEKFIEKGNKITIEKEELQELSKMLYNVLITIAIAVAVVVGGIIGIKLMISSAEHKAEVKQYLLPYIIGCIAVFGAFGIWKLVVTIIENFNV